MAELVNTAVSGLMAYQRALATVGNNIANVNNPGYSRQTIDIESQIPDSSGIGNGIKSAAIKRQFNQFIATQQRTDISEFNRLDSFYELSSLVDDVLADPEGGISPTIQNFFNGLQNVSNDPGSIAARTELLNQGDALVSRFQLIDNRLNSFNTLVDNQVKRDIDEVNALALSLQKVNKNIVSAQGVQGQVPPDLLDQRDRVINQLSEKVSVQAVIESNQTATVFIGSGQMLVDKANTFQLQATADPADPARVRVSYQGTAQTVDITSTLSGGTIGGALNFRSELLDPSRNYLGRIALSITSEMNAQHREGMDLDNNLGSDFFSIGEPKILTDARNTGTATLTAKVTDVSALSNQDYRLSYDGTNWSLQTKNGSSTTGAQAGPTLTLDGLEVTIASGSANAGDSFIIKPSYGAASEISMAISEARKVAAAVPVIAQANLQNQSKAKISQPEILDVTDANLLDDVTIKFTSASSYDIVDSTSGAVILGAQAYTNGANIDINGSRVVISGNPLTGDQFRIRANSNAKTDNRNALEMNKLVSKKVLDSGTSTLQDVYNTMVSEVGSQTRQSEISRSVQSAMLDSINAQRESVSGVNLDEEAANLLKYQQAYQASARVVNVAKDLFQTLMNAV